MALRRSLVQLTKTSSSPLTIISSASQSRFLETSVVSDDPARKNFSREFLTAKDSCKNGFFRRFVQRRAIVQSTDFRHVPSGDKLMEKLRGMNLSRDLLRLDGLISSGSPPEEKRRDECLEGISVGDARKLLRLSQMEMLKSRLRRIPKSCISYAEFVQICKDDSSLNPEQGLEFAKMLDESGAVIVLGNLVFLQPEQVAKAIEGAIQMPTTHPNDPRMKELEKMEELKEAIDTKAESLVRRELWCGLGLLVLQTAGFMRLTFWDLSWDVMEPICFFVTSFNFMVGYLFFLRTSRNPSFEGFFQRRFSTKQKRLMKTNEFDMERFKELQRACYPFSSHPTSPSSSAPLCSSSFNNSSERPTLICALDH